VPFVVTCREEVLEAEALSDEEECAFHRTRDRPLLPLVLQAGHVGEVGTRDEHVA